MRSCPDTDIDPHFSDDEYITSGKDGLVLEDVAHDRTYVLLDPKKMVIIYVDYQMGGPFGKKKLCLRC